MPSPVDKYHEQVKKDNPDYSDEQAWATAWSIYCVAADTYVFTSSGMMTIGEIASKSMGEKVVHSDGVVSRSVLTAISTHRGQGFTSQVVSTGVKSAVRVTTKHGYSLTCTPEHLLLALGEDYSVEWVQAGECVDRYLILPTHGIWGNSIILPKRTYIQRAHNNIVPFRQPTMMTRTLARVLGYLVAEGSITEEGLEFSNSDPKVVRDYVRCMSLLFGETPVINWVQPEESNKLTMPAAKVRSRTRWYKEFFTSVGLVPCMADEKVVPPTILNSSKKIVLEFLRGYVEGDGFVGDVKHPNRIDLSTASKTLALQLHLILSNLGVLATLEENKDGYYTVRVNSEPMVRKFASVVGGGVFKTPVITTNRMKDRGSEFECVPAKGVISLHKRVANAIPGSSRVSLSRIKRFWWLLEASVGSNSTLSNLRDLMDEGYLFDPVVSVVPVGEIEVFDLSVPGDESFVANGLIAHNCKHKNPGSPHCHKPPGEYLKGKEASDLARDSEDALIIERVASKFASLKASNLADYEVTVRNKILLRGRTTEEDYDKVITVYNARSRASAIKAVAGKGKVVDVKKLPK